MPGAGLGENPRSHNGAHITLIDYRGKKHSQFIATSGGGVNTNADRDLANEIAKCSNASILAYGKSEMNEYNISDLDAYDEAEASVERQIVIVYQSNDNPLLKREVIIPAFDASLLLPDMTTPDRTKIQAVIDKGRDLINDDGSALNPGDYEFVRAYTTTRKVGRRVSGGDVAKPNLSEPSPTADPGPGPAALP